MPASRKEPGDRSSGRRARRRAPAALALAAVIAVGVAAAIALALALRGSGQGAPESAAGQRPSGTASGPIAPYREPASPPIDPRTIPFPRDLAPREEGLLHRAVDLHLRALDGLRRGQGEAAALAREALKLYDEAGCLLPQLAQLHHLTVVDGFRRGERAAAVAEAERWLERFPDSPDHLEALGNAEFLAGRVDRAASLLERAAVLRPFSVGLRRRLARAYSDLGRKDEGLRAAGEGLRLVGYPRPGFWSHPEALETVRVALNTSYRFYDYTGLLPIAQALVARYPDDPSGLLALGVALLNAGDFAGAVPPLRKAAADPALGDDASLELGVALLKEGNPSEAARELCSLLEKRPWESRAYTQLGACLARLGKTEASEAMLAMARALAPSDREMLREVELRGAGKRAESRRARAKGLLLRGQVREAEEALRDPALGDDPAAAIYRVELLVETLRGKEAEEELKASAALLGPDHPEVVGWTAICLATQGNYDRAAAMLEPLARMDLPGKRWPAFLGLLRLEDLEDAKGAIPWLERALGDPPLPAELALLGTALLEAGDPRRAREVLERVGRNEVVWDEMARVPLALAIIRAAPAERRAAEDLLAAGPPAPRARRTYALAVAELLEGATGDAERARARSSREEAELLLSLERRWRAARARAASSAPAERSAPLLEAAAVLRDLGDRSEAIRVARLAAAAAPGSPEGHRFLAGLLDAPGEVYYRIAALKAWHGAAPADPEAGRAIEEARRTVTY